MWHWAEMVGVKRRQTLSFLRPQVDSQAMSFPVPLGPETHMW